MLLAIWLVCGYAIAIAAGNEMFTPAPTEPVESTEVEMPPKQDVPTDKQVTSPEICDGANDKSTPEPIEDGIPQAEWVYIRVNGAMLYSSKSMKASREMGTVTGIALALHYIEDNQGKAIRAVFVTKEGVLHEGIFATPAVQALTYQEAMEQIGGDVCRSFADNEAWPLPGAAFNPVERKRTSKPTKEAIGAIEIAEATETTEAKETTMEAAPTPHVVITSNMESRLIVGASVVLTAEVFHLDENQIAGYQWLRNVGGELQEVLGVTGNVYTFLASEENSDCEYVVVVLLH